MSLDEADILRRVERLQARYIRCVDDDRLEEWPDLFTDPCLYRIVTRENFARNLPLSILECRSHGMLQDRVTGYRRVNIYEPQRYNHQLSGLAIEAVDGAMVTCRSNYLVVRTIGDGTMSLFSCGFCLDRIRLDAEGARFAERIVVQDSRQVDTLLVIPL